MKEISKGEMTLADMNISSGLAEKLPGKFGEWFARRAKEIEERLASLTDAEIEELMEDLADDMKE